MGPGNMTANHYTFGDNPTAEKRLEYLADAFEPSSRAWFDSLGFTACNSAVDLGCGVGRTTTLLAEHFAPEQLVGLDNSQRLLNHARLQSYTRALFVAHDVTQSPFPIPPAELLYARFLLTHLANPAQVLSTWAQALKPGGLLLLEDTAALYSEYPDYQRYYQIVAAMQAHYGQKQQIGHDFESLVDKQVWSVVRSELRPVHLLGQVMARLHAMNIVTWKSDPYIKETVSPAELVELSTTFEHFAEAKEAPPVICKMRQAVLKKVSTNPTVC